MNANVSFPSMATAQPPPSIPSLSRLSTPLSQDMAGRGVATLPHTINAKSQFQSAYVYQPTPPPGSESEATARPEMLQPPAQPSVDQKITLSAITEVPDVDQQPPPQPPTPQAVHEKIHRRKHSSIFKDIPRPNDPNDAPKDVVVLVCDGALRTSSTSSMSEVGNEGLSIAAISSTLGNLQRETKKATATRLHLQPEEQGEEATAKTRRQRRKGTSPNGGIPYPKRCSFQDTVTARQRPPGPCRHVFRRCGLTVCGCVRRPKMALHPAWRRH